MTMCRIDYDTIYLCIYESCYAIHNILCDTDSCTTQKTSLLVLCRQRILDLLLNILNGDQTL